MASINACILILVMLGICLANEKCKETKQDYMDNVDCVVKILKDYDEEYFLTEQDESDIDNCVFEKYGYYDDSGNFNEDGIIKDFDNYDYDKETKQQLSDAVTGCAKNHTEANEAIDCFTGNYLDICYGTEN